MDEEFDSVLDFDGTGSDYIDNDIDIVSDDEEVIDGVEDEPAIAGTSTLVIDYSYQELIVDKLSETNQYLYVLVILFLSFVCMYCFTALRNFFQRLGV